MAIPELDFLQQPLVDDMLDYDYTNHRYIPTINGVKNTAYLDLVVIWGSTENAQSYLELLSQVVYDVILSKVDGDKNKNKVLYYIAHSKEMRNLMIDIFKDSVWYNQRDGGFMLAYNSGVNLNLGKFMEFGIDKSLSVIAQQKIKNSPLGNRVLKYNLNDFHYFATLDELKTFLVGKGVIENSQLDEIESIDYIKNNHYRYKIRGYNSYGLIVVEDLKTYTEKILKTMKIYDNSDGSW